jgi:uncharacterized Zn finger protein
MVKPACPKCAKDRFQLTVISPAGSAHKIAYHHCASCGTVVGTTPYNDVGTIADELTAKLDRILELLDR